VNSPSMRKEPLLVTVILADIVLIAAMRGYGSQR
jgi:hypothetical protein